jgi:hypothetical protein
MIPRSLPAALLLLAILAPACGDDGGSETVYSCSINDDQGALLICFEPQFASEEEFNKTAAINLSGPNGEVGSCKPVEDACPADGKECGTLEDGEPIFVYGDNKCTVLNGN